MKITEITVKKPKLSLNIRRLNASILVLSMLVGVSMASLPRAIAATSASLINGPKVSFTFDDGYASAYTQAEPTLAKYGLVGTDYVISGCVGMTTAPNTCNADESATYMTWAQVQGLQADGWEIGDHTVDHVCLASSGETDPSDCANPAPLTTAQIDAELANSKSALEAEGLNVTDFATPYGDYNNNVLAQVGKYFASHRGFADVNNNVFPYNDYLLNDFQVQEGVTVAQVETAIQTAITNNYWLVLTFHDIQQTPDTSSGSYQYGTSELDQIAAYVKSEIQAGLINCVLIRQGLASSSSNMLPDSDFSSGIADGWSTDATTAITADSGDNGSFPNPTYSVKFAAGTVDEHLFSPTVTVTPGTTYLIKSYLNLLTITSGKVSYYVDEYNSSGVWMSGKNYTQEVNPFVEDMNFLYTPTTTDASPVASARIQFIVTANSGATGYVDNFQMFPESDADTGNGTPVVPVTVSTTPGDINGDGKVDALDLSILLSNWGKTGATAAQGDLNGDGTVNALDLSILLANWGK